MRGLINIKSFLILKGIYYIIREVKKTYRVICNLDTN